MGIVWTTTGLRDRMTLNSSRDVAEKFPDAQVMGTPPSKSHIFKFCTDVLTQEPISPLPGRIIRSQISLSTSTTVVVNGSPLQTISTTSMYGTFTLALPTGLLSTNNALSEHGPLQDSLVPS